MKYIQEGRIKTIGELRRVYRRLVMQTHPDAVGSDRLSHKFREFYAGYEEARKFLREPKPAGAGPAGEHPADPRLAFYLHLRLLERTDTPFNFFVKRDAAKVDALKAETCKWFMEWRGDLTDLYIKANRQYDQLKREKPLGPYRKHALYFNLHPFFHNIVAYQVLGKEFYRRQLKQNLPAVTARLEEREFPELRDYLLFLIRDAENGSAGARGEGEGGGG